MIDPNQVLIPIPPMTAGAVMVTAARSATLAPWMPTSASVLLEERIQSGDEVARQVRDYLEGVRAIPLIDLPIKVDGQFVRLIS